MVSAQVAVLQIMEFAQTVAEKTFLLQCLDFPTLLSHLAMLAKSAAFAFDSLMLDLSVNTLHLHPAVRKFVTSDVEESTKKKKSDFFLFFFSFTCRFTKI